MDCSLPVSSVPGIFPARILERVAISSSRGSSQPRDQTFVSCIGRQILYHRAPWEAPSLPPVSKDYNRVLRARVSGGHESICCYYTDIIGEHRPVVL